MKTTRYLFCLLLAIQTNFVFAAPDPIGIPLPTPDTSSTSDAFGHPLPPVGQAASDIGESEEANRPLSVIGLQQVHDPGDPSNSLDGRPVLTPSGGDPNARQNLSNGYTILAPLNFTKARPDFKKPEHADYWLMIRHVSKADLDKYGNDVHESGVIVLAPDITAAAFSAAIKDKLIFELQERFAPPFLYATHFFRQQINQIHSNPAALVSGLTLTGLEFARWFTNPDLNTFQHIFIPFCLVLPIGITANVFKKNWDKFKNPIQDFALRTVFRIKPDSPLNKSLFAEYIGNGAMIGAITSIYLLVAHPPFDAEAVHSLAKEWTYLVFGQTSLIALLRGQITRAQQNEKENEVAISIHDLTFSLSIAALNAKVPLSPFKKNIDLLWDALKNPAANQGGWAALVEKSPDHMSSVGYLAGLTFLAGLFYAADSYKQMLTKFYDNFGVTQAIFQVVRFASWMTGLAVLQFKKYFVLPFVLRHGKFLPDGVGDYMRAHEFEAAIGTARAGFDQAAQIYLEAEKLGPNAVENLVASQNRLIRGPTDIQPIFPIARSDGRSDENGSSCGRAAE